MINFQIGFKIDRIMSMEFNEINKYKIQLNVRKPMHILAIHSLKPIYHSRNRLEKEKIGT